MLKAYFCRLYNCQLNEGYHQFFEKNGVKKCE
jgi:hypothetical protein